MSNYDTTTILLETTVSCVGAPWQAQSRSPAAHARPICCAILIRICYCICCTKRVIIPDFRWLCERKRVLSLPGTDLCGFVRCWCSARLQLEIGVPASSLRTRACTSPTPVWSTLARAAALASARTPWPPSTPGTSPSIRISPRSSGLACTQPLDCCAPSGRAHY